jgi:hypothetical protein
MSDYNSIRGQTVAINPSTSPLMSGGNSRIFYNSFNPSAFVAYTDPSSDGVWTATAGQISPANRSSALGTQTATLFAGGGTPPFSNPTNSNVEYNGQVFSSATNVPVAIQRNGACGTLTAGLVFGGISQNNTIKYDGSVWTTSTNLPVNYSYGAGCGTQTAALSCAGSFTGLPNVTLEFDGSVWSSGGNIINQRFEAGGCGTQTAGLCVGGRNPTNPAGTTFVEEYDGSVWAAGSVVPFVKNNYGLAGTQTAALVFGGPAQQAAKYDGSVWTVTTSGPFAAQFYGTGSQTEAISGNTGYSVGVQKFNGPGNQIKRLTATF